MVVIDGNIKRIFSQLRSCSDISTVIQQNLNNTKMTDFARHVK